MVQVIPPRSGVAFELRRGQRMRVIDPEGEQVSDLLAYNLDDIGEVLSSGRSLDYASSIFLGKGDPLYSNRSRIMLRIVEDSVGRHDFLLTPCSSEMFRIIYGDPEPHRGCFGNLAAALVFNLHSQFETLREDGRYEKLRAAITERDIAFSGSRNPMLKQHGESSEARQYSGREVGAEWRCPFSAQAE